MLQRIRKKDTPAGNTQDKETHESTERQDTENPQKDTQDKEAHESTETKDTEKPRKYSCYSTSQPRVPGEIDTPCRHEVENVSQFVTPTHVTPTI